MQLRLDIITGAALVTGGNRDLRRRDLSRTRTIVRNKLIRGVAFSGLLNQNNVDVPIDGDTTSNVQRVVERVNIKDNSGVVILSEISLKKDGRVERDGIGKENVI